MIAGFRMEVGEVSTVISAPDRVFQAKYLKTSGTHIAPSEVLARWLSRLASKRSEQVLHVLPASRNSSAT